MLWSAPGAGVEFDRAILLMTLPVVVIILMIIENWTNTLVSMQIAIAYAAGVIVGAVWQRYEATSTKS